MTAAKFRCLCIYVGAEYGYNIAAKIRTIISYLSVYSRVSGVRFIVEL